MKVYYFDIYGRAEAMRMMLWKAGVAYEDVRVGANFVELKPTLEYGQVPQLELDDGTKLVQTEAILAYLAATYGFAPKDPMDCYKAQHLLSYINEDFMSRKFMKWYFGAEEDKAAAAESLFKTDVPALLAVLDKKVGEHKFILGDSLSLVDFCVGGMITNMFLNPNSALKAQWEAAWANAGENLKTYATNFQAEMKEYLEARPQTCAM